MFHESVSHKFSYNQRMIQNCKRRKPFAAKNSQKSQKRKCRSKELECYPGCQRDFLFLFFVLFCGDSERRSRDRERTVFFRSSTIAASPLTDCRRKTKQKNPSGTQGTRMPNGDGGNGFAAVYILESPLM